MFERFTDRARRVIVLAQEEARALNHNYIGTEHFLLGLIREGGGVGARALRSLGVSFTAVRMELEEIIGPGQTPPSGQIPFTPRAKKVLQGALREALQLNHNYIGTEHILLGLIREGDGVGAQVLVKMGVGLNEARAQVIAHLEGYVKTAVAEAAGGAAFVAREEGSRTASRRQPVTGPTCPGCAAPLDESAVYRILDVPEHEGDGKATVLFLYCKACGLAIDDVILPEGE